MSKPLAELKVGDEVIIRDVNERRSRGRRVGKVVKVGRTLLHVETGYGVETFEIDGGQRNDAYRHSWIVTHEMQVEADRRADLLSRLRDHHLEIHHAWQKDYSTEQLEAIVRAVESFESADSECCEVPA